MVPGLLLVLEGFSSGDGLHTAPVWQDGRESRFRHLDLPGPSWALWIMEKIQGWLKYFGQGCMSARSVLLLGIAVTGFYAWRSGPGPDANPSGSGPHSLSALESTAANQFMMAQCNAVKIP